MPLSVKIQAVHGSRERVEGVYKVAFESLWENCFSEMGYREFKRDLYNGNLFEEFVRRLWVSMMSC